MLLSFKEVSLEERIFSNVSFNAFLALSEKFFRNFPASAKRLCVCGSSLVSTDGTIDSASAGFSAAVSVAEEPAFSSFRERMFLTKSSVTGAAFAEEGSNA